MKSEQTMTPIDELPLTDELVSAYLQDNPEFFSRNNELMTSLRLSDTQRGTVSLSQSSNTEIWVGPTGYGSRATFDIDLCDLESICIYYPDPSHPDNQSEIELSDFFAEVRSCPSEPTRHSGMIWEPIIESLPERDPTGDVYDFAGKDYRTQCKYWCQDRMEHVVLLTHDGSGIVVPVCDLEEEKLVERDGVRLGKWVKAEAGDQGSCRLIDNDGWLNGELLEVDGDFITVKIKKTCEVRK